jgi:endonuclease YncB( thermonuclease family)
MRGLTRHLFTSLIMALCVLVMPELRPASSGGPDIALSGVSSLNFSQSAFAQEQIKGVKWAGPFKVQVIEVKDGDTVEILFKEGPCSEGGLGAPCAGSIMALRVRGIDTPEKKLCQRQGSQSCAACPQEAKLGQASTRTAKALLEGKLIAYVRDLGRDPYFGRVVGTIDILHEGRLQSYATLMIEAGLASRYDPLADGTYRKTKNWCPAPQPQS